MTKPGDLQTKKTLHELAKEFPEKTYRELEKYRDADRVEEAIGMGHNNPPDLVEVLAVENDKLKKRAQEAEGELSILKGIETNRVKEAQARSNQLQDELDRVGRENNDLYNKIADLTEVAKSKDYFRDPDYKFLIEENRRLEEERNEVLATNKRLILEVEGKIPKMRKAGM
jgi:hypothetical protein